MALIESGFSVSDLNHFQLEMLFGGKRCSVCHNGEYSVSSTISDLEPAPNDKFKILGEKFRVACTNPKCGAVVQLPSAILVFEVAVGL